jgi:hypothetical protein
MCFYRPNRSPLENVLETERILVSSYAMLRVAAPDSITAAGSASPVD